jgi:hypothetical protein
VCSANAPARSHAIAPAAMLALPTRPRGTRPRDRSSIAFAREAAASHLVVDLRARRRVEGAECDGVHAGSVDGVARIVEAILRRFDSHRLPGGDKAPTPARRPGRLPVARVPRA